MLTQVGGKHKTLESLLDETHGEELSINGLLQKYHLQTAIYQYPDESVFSLPTFIVSRFIRDMSTFDLV